jgi:hypothetical protein
MRYSFALRKATTRARLMREIHSQLVVDDFGCWMWRGKTHRGYGSIAGLGVHRVAYESLVGPVPDGLVIDHTCHNPETCVNGERCPHRRCANPLHMEPVTPYENWKRGAKGREFFARLPAGREHQARGAQTARAA